MAENFDLRLNIEGPGEPHSIPLPFGEIVIGRQPGSDLYLADNLVSRSHARLVRSESGCLLIDLGSANKTYLNDHKLEPQVPTPVAPGDTIRIGPYQLRLEVIPLPDVLAELAPAPMVELPPEREEGNGKDEALSPLPLPLPPPEPAQEFSSPVPPGLSIKSQRLIHYLPDIYQTDFMRRFLGLFESIQAPIEWNIDNFDLFLNPATAPEGFLPWLANWFEFAWGPDWTDEQRRTFLQEAHQIYARRGTRWALSRVLEIYTGVTPEIEDSREDLAPFTFHVRIPSTQGPFQRAQIEALIEANKPAYTAFILEIL
jgi:phage tail-like protein